ncbi:MAG: SgcJ/EcaC family oxidoreductase [Rhodospirillaceae bacterium]
MNDLERGVRALHQTLLEAWNRRDAAGMARCFAPDGMQIGFDGSHTSGAAAIEAHLAPIFTDHPTGRFVSIVRDVRELSPSVGLLRADAGMIPAGKNDINPALNTVQSLVARRIDGAWKVCLFQNTPAAFHGRPEAVETMSAELRAAARTS